MGDVFKLVKTLGTFEWAKGWRSVSVVGVVLVVFVLETWLGVDVPGVEMTLEHVWLALGVGAAAAHEV